jgi:DNA-binding Lrp family transcriptional regulator
MDSKDVRIFCEMGLKDLIFGSSRRASPSEIGRKIGLDEKTVRLRVKKMEESGFIKYYQATPNLMLLGMKFQETFRFEAMNIPTKFKALEYMHSLFGILEAQDFLGPAVAISLAGRSLAEIGSVAKQLASRFELSRASTGSHDLPKAALRLDSLDWKILGKLRYAAHANSKDIADDLGVTQRMVLYRIEKLSETGALETRPVIDPKNQQGIVFYEIEASIDPSAEGAFRKRLQETQGERMWSLRVAPNGFLIANLFGFTLADPEASEMELRSIEGVRWCSISVLKEVIEPKKPNWIDRLIEEKITTS